MYNVPVGPSKIAAKTRRGISQNMNSKDCQLSKRTNGHGNHEPVSAPRPVFNTSQKTKTGQCRPHETWSPDYEEVVKFVTETWDVVWKDYEEHVRNNTTGPESVMYYEETTPCRALENFKPFDIEAWWEKRLFENITKNSEESCVSSEQPALHPLRNLADHSFQIL